MEMALFKLYRKAIARFVQAGRLNKIFLAVCVRLPALWNFVYERAEGGIPLGRLNNLVLSFSSFVFIRHRASSIQATLRVEILDNLPLF
jgi:hypothetical protein